MHHFVQPSIKASRCVDADLCVFLHLMAASAADVEFARTTLCASLIGWLLRQVCRAWTQCYLALLWVCTPFFQVKDRAPQRLAPAATLREEVSMMTEDMGKLTGFECLPPVPPLPEDERTDTVAFAGCANLCCYTLGAAFALQQAPNYADLRRRGKLRVVGGSSGALVGAFFAMDIDCGVCMHIMRARFRRHRHRLGGCIGIFSREVRDILRTAIRDSNRAGRTDGPVDRLEGERLRVSVTRFNPWPQHATISSFSDEDAVLDAVLASCYIPVAYEAPVVLNAPRLGFCVDGCAISFLPQASCVVSPYHEHRAEIAPAVEFPAALVFSLVHADDVLALFEAGYRDTVRWLESGAPSRERQRATKSAQAAGGGLGAFATVALQVLLEIAGVERASIERAKAVLRSHFAGWAAKRAP